MDIKMIGITVTVKLQNKLAKNSIMMSLKSISEHLFSETGGLLLRSFTHIPDTQVDLFHVWKDRTFQEKARKSFSTQFWKAFASAAWAMANWSRSSLSLAFRLACRVSVFRNHA